VSVRGEGCYFPLEKLRKTRQDLVMKTDFSFYEIVVEDPLDSMNNTTRTCFKIGVIQKAFCDAYYKLMEPLEKPPLQSLLEKYERFDKEREQREKDNREKEPGLKKDKNEGVKSNDGSDSRIDVKNGGADVQAGEISGSSERKESSPPPNKGILSVNAPQFKPESKDAPQVQSEKKVSESSLSPGNVETPLRTRDDLKVPSKLQQLVSYNPLVTVRRLFTNNYFKDAALFGNPEVLLLPRSVLGGVEMKHHPVQAAFLPSNYNMFKQQQKTYNQMPHGPMHHQPFSNNLSFYAYQGRDYPQHYAFAFPPYSHISRVSPVPSPVPPPSQYYFAPPAPTLTAMQSVPLFTSQQQAMYGQYPALAQHNAAILPPLGMTSVGVQTQAIPLHLTSGESVLNKNRATTPRNSSND
jgi:hypothetical protein